MASILRVNTLTDASSGNSTAMSTINQGTAKAWANINGTGTIATRDSFNIASLTDEATGGYAYNFTNNMQNNDFPVTTNAFRDSDEYIGIYFDDNTTSLTKTRIYTRGSATRSDTDSVYLAVHGDLA